MLAKDPEKVGWTHDPHPFDRHEVQEIFIEADEKVGRRYDGIGHQVIILAVTSDLWERLGETWHVVDHRAHELDKITRGLSRNASGEIRSLDELPVQFLRDTRGKEQTILTVESGVYHSAGRGGRPHRREEIAEEDVGVEQGANRHPLVTVALKGQDPASSHIVDDLM